MEEKMPVLFTIDVEGTRGKETIEHEIWGLASDGKKYGIELIVDTIVKHGAHGLFFVDFAECCDYGFDKIKKVVDYLIENNQLVGVHLHPRHFMLGSSDFLCDYSLEEQEQMIEYCTNMYIKMVGSRPVFFRAGKYGADYNTLLLLKKNKYIFDFSEFYGNKWCGLKPDLCHVLPCQVDGIVEIPVTVFCSFKFLSFYKRHDKVDFDIPLSELKEVMSKYSKKRGEKPIFILFGHSFSLLDFRFKDENPNFNKKSLIKLERVLEYISTSDNYTFVDDSYLLARHYSDKKDSSCDIVSTPFLKSLIFTFLRAWEIKKYNKKARCGFLFFFLFLALLVATVVLILIFSLNG